MRDLGAEVWKVVGLIESGELDKPSLLLKAIALVAQVRESNLKTNAEPKRDASLARVMDKINGAKS